MSDKEPRRRKNKRKDFQAARKEDLHSDDHFFTSMKADVKDSDQENDDEIPLPSNQPSLCAKFVFVLLFSALVVSMSFVYISLQGTNRRELELFEEEHHAEEPDVLTYNMHDIHEADHGEEEHHETEHGDDEHDEPEDTVKWSLSNTFSQENIEALLPGISNILSFQSGASEDSEETNEQDPSTTEETDLPTEDQKESIEDVPDEVDMKSEIVGENDSNDIEEADDIEENEDDDEEDEISPEVSTTSAPPQDTFKTETTSQPPQTHSEPPQDYREETATSPPVEESDYSTSLPDDEEEFASTLEELSNEPPQDASEDVAFYERMDITNEADYEIRRELDELEKALEQGFDDNDDNDHDDNNDHDNVVDDDNDDDNINNQGDDDDEEEDDDDDYEGDDGIVDEFDFWQF